MAHFAKIENNIVTQVIVVNNDVCGEPTLTFPDTDSAGRAYIANGLKLDGTFAQTSIDGSFRGCYAGIGYTFNGTDFIAPVQPEPQPESP